MTDINELVRFITALLALNERNVIVPHIARDCLKAAAAALEAGGRGKSPGPFSLSGISPLPAPQAPHPRFPKREICVPLLQ